MQVARLVVARHQPQIAADLFLSTKTIEAHLRNIFHKLDLTSRVQLAHAVERADRDRADRSRRTPAPYKKRNERERRAPGRARGLWEGLAGSRFPDPGMVRVVENPGSRICRQAGRASSGSPVRSWPPRTAAQAELLRRTADPGALPVLDLLGPAQLAYTADRPQAADPVEWVGAADLSELISAVAADEATERRRRAAPCRGGRKGGRIIAAAGWAPWPARTAHLCVLTAVTPAAARDPGRRGGDRGRARGRDAATVASPNRGISTSRGKLGYRVLGEQLSLQLHALTRHRASDASRCAPPSRPRPPAHACGQ